jgi:hypothetical protein
MKPRKILRRKEACGRLGCGRTKFIEDYEFHDAADPFVPGTQIRRVRSIRLGPVNSGFLEHELDALIDALAEAGGHIESKNAKAAARDAMLLNTKAARDAKVEAQAAPKAAPAS